MPMRPGCSLSIMRTTSVRNFCIGDECLGLAGPAVQPSPHDQRLQLHLMMWLCRGCVQQGVAVYAFTCPRAADRDRCGARAGVHARQKGGRHHTPRPQASKPHGLGLPVPVAVRGPHAACAPRRAVMLSRKGLGFSSPTQAGEFIRPTCCMLACVAGMLSREAFGARVFGSSRGSHETQWCSSTLHRCCLPL